MIASIHQPHFLPWAGYLNKVVHSDVFVWLHSVQFRKNYFQNRTRIKSGNEPHWLTLPVHARLETTIDEVLIADHKWRNRAHKTIEQCYRKTPFFEQCWPTLDSALMKAPDTLDGVNYQTFLALMELLEIRHVKVVRAEEIPVDSDDPTTRLIEINTKLGATSYIAGKGGHNYLHTDEFEKAGIGVIWQRFEPERFIYNQPGTTFIPGLSVIDCIFNIGPVKAREFIEKAWTP